MIARRCVYGVDLNPISTELARVSMWIHTFVPGLPLSFLDHNLRVGDSLTGIGTLDEAMGSPANVAESTDSTGGPRFAAPISCRRRGSWRSCSRPSWTRTGAAASRGRSRSPRPADGAMREWSARP